MSDDWQVGDLAVAKGLEKGEQPFGPTAEKHPTNGQIYRVTRVRWFVVTGLEIDGWDGWWDARCFRKIRPDEQKGEREDWQLLLNSMRRRVDA